jgi:hypothetical protein
MVFSAKFLENVLQVITDTKIPENYEIKRKEKRFGLALPVFFFRIDEPLAEAI